MSKIVLADTISGYNLQVINNNFDMIEAALNNKVLYRDNPDGEPNSMADPLDMNGQRIINLPAPGGLNDAARMQDIVDATAGITNATAMPFSPTATIAATNVQGAIAEADTENRALSAAIVTDLATSNNTAKGDALVAVKRSETGTVATTQHIINQQRPASLVADFGAVGDGTTDDSAAFVLAAASGAKVIDGGGLTYRIVTKHTISNSGRWQNMTRKFDGANTTRICDVTATDVEFIGIVDDGNNKQPRGSLVYVDANAARFSQYYCLTKDMLGTTYGTNVLNQMCGLNINPYGVTDFKIIGSQYRNIRKYNDGSLITAAVGLGFVGGIYFMVEDHSDPAAAQPTPSRGIIAGCTFDTIQTILAGGLTDNQVADFDDGDAIRTYAGTGAKKLDVRITDSKFIACSKRAVKLRASGGVFTDSEIYTAGNAYGMSTPIDLVHDCTADNIKIFASSSIPLIKTATMSIGGNATNSQTTLRDIWASHAKIGVEIIGVAANPLENFTIDGLVLPHVTGTGILEAGGGLPTTQRNLVIRRVEIQGNGNNCAGLGLSLGADNTGGWDVDQVSLTNADWKIEGINNTIGTITTNITSSSFAGSSTTRALAEIGNGKGLGGYINAGKLIFNLAGINTSYKTASRPYLIFAGADNMVVDEFKITTPDGMVLTYPDLEFFGDDSYVGKIDYYGPGYLRLGHLVASTRWGYGEAVRRGNGATSEAFIRLASAATNYSYGKTVDYRPTTATTIINTVATNGIAGPIYTRSSHGTPGASGVAKTHDINTF